MNIKGILGVGIIGIAVMLTSCKNKEEVQTAKKVKFVKVEEVGNSLGRNKLVFNGTVKEKSLTSLSFRVGGPLVKLNVKPGDYVKKGQVIAEIDKRDYELQKKSTKAQMQQLEGEYNRYKELLENDRIPANSFEKIESGYLMAKVGYENAVNQLNDTKLKAPYSGYIFEKFTENHQTVGPGQPIFSIIDVSELEAITAVPENQLSVVKDCNTGLLDVKNANVKHMPVSLFSVSEKARRDGLYEVKFRFENKADMSISPGMTAEIIMNGESDQQALNVPSSAIFNDGKSNCVWIYNESTKTVSKRNLKLKAFSSGGRVEVASGLNIGETVVVAGVNSIIEGQEVQVIKDPSETNIGGLL